MTRQLSASHVTGEYVEFKGHMLRSLGEGRLSLSIDSANAQQIICGTFSRPSNGVNGGETVFPRCVSIITLCVCGCAQRTDQSEQ